MPRQPLHGLDGPRLRPARRRGPAGRGSDAPATPSTSPVPRGPGPTGAREDRRQLLRHHLAELDAPLVEGVDAPHGALDEHGVLVERHQLPQDRRGQLRGEDGGAGPVAGHHLVRHELGRCALGRDLLGRLAEGEGLGLRQAVGHEEVVLLPRLVGALGEGDEVGRDQLRALVQQLVEGVLPVGARLAPEDLAGLPRPPGCRPAAPTCRWTPSSAAAGRPGSGPAGGCRAARRGSARRRSCCTRR